MGGPAFREDRLGPVDGQMAGDHSPPVHRDDDAVAPADGLVGELKAVVITGERAGLEALHTIPGRLAIDEQVGRQALHAGDVGRCGVFGPGHEHGHADTHDQRGRRRQERPASQPRPRPGTAGAGRAQGRCHHGRGAVAQQLRVRFLEPLQTLPQRRISRQGFFDPPRFLGGQLVETVALELPVGELRRRDRVRCHGDPPSGLSY